MPIFITVIFKFLSPVFTVIKDIVSIVIPIPVFAIILIGVWLYIDRGSAIRVAVHNAVVEMVAKAELQAKDAVITFKDQQLADQQEAIDRQAKRLEDEEKNRLEFESEIQLNDQKVQDLEKKLNEKPADQKQDATSCSGTISKQFYDLLR